jgi:hypothetical protein
MADGLAVNAKAAAVVLTVPQAPGLDRLGKVWFVSTREGATWVTNSDPTLKDFSSGLVYPLNDKARAASDVGVDAARDVSGFADGHPSAVESRSCAQKL